MDLECSSEADYGIGHLPGSEKAKKPVKGERAKPFPIISPVQRRQEEWTASKTDAPDHFQRPVPSASSRKPTAATLSVYRYGGDMKPYNSMNQLPSQPASSQFDFTELANANDSSAFSEGMSRTIKTGRASIETQRIFRAGNGFSSASASTPRSSSPSTPVSSASVRKKTTPVRAKSKNEDPIELDCDDTQETKSMFAVKPNELLIVDKLFNGEESEMLKDAIQKDFDANTPKVEGMEMANTTVDIEGTFLQDSPRIIARHKKGRKLHLSLADRYRFEIVSRGRAVNDAYTVLLLDRTEISRAKFDWDRRMLILSVPILPDAFEVRPDEEWIRKSACFDIGLELSLMSESRLKPIVERIRSMLNCKLEEIQNLPLKAAPKRKAKESDSDFEERTKSNKSLARTYTLRNRVGRVSSEPDSPPLFQSLPKRKLFVSAIPVNDVRPRVLFTYPHGVSDAIEITSNELKRLPEGIYLNDSLIDFALRYWWNRSLSDSPSSVDVGGEGRRMSPAERMHIYSSFFFRKLSDAVSRNEQIQLSKHDIFSKQFTVVPINESLHWYVAIIYQADRLLISKNDRLGNDVDEKPTVLEDDQEKTWIVVFDSLGSRARKPAIDKLKRYLLEAARLRHSSSSETIEDRIKWTYAKVPKQLNYTDCGLFLIQNVRHLLIEGDSLIERALDHEDLTDLFSVDQAALVRLEIKELVDVMEVEAGIQKNSGGEKRDDVGCSSDIEEITHL